MCSWAAGAPSVVTRKPASNRHGDGFGARRCRARRGYMYWQEHIPQMAVPGQPLTITTRAGFNAWWMSLALAGNRYRWRVHFVMTGELTFPGKWYAPLGGGSPLACSSGLATNLRVLRRCRPCRRGPRMWRHAPRRCGRCWIRPIPPAGHHRPGPGGRRPTGADCLTCRQQARDGSFLLLAEAGLPDPAGGVLERGWGHCACTSERHTFKDQGWAHEQRKRTLPLPRLSWEESLPCCGKAGREFGTTPACNSFDDTCVILS